MPPVHSRLMAAAAAAVVVLAAFAPPASASMRAVARPRVGAVCARRAVGAVTTARTGVTVRCTTIRRGRYRWVRVASAPAPAPLPAPTASYTATGWKADMLALVNAERTKVGARALTACPRLDGAGQLEVADNAARGVLDHLNADGATVGVRDTRSGYLVGANGYKVGENIALGYGDVPSVMNGWMNSPGHRANLLDPSYTHLGMALQDSATGRFWAQEFGVGGTC